MLWLLQSIFKRKILLGGGNINESLSNFNTKFNLPNSEARFWGINSDSVGKKKNRQSTFRDRSGVPGATIRQMGWHSEVSWKTHDITVLKEKWKEARDKHNALDSSAEEVFLLSRCV